MLRSPLLASTPHGFTDRRDGDLRPPLGEAHAAVVAALSGVGPLRMVTQVHGRDVVRAESLGEDPVEADAIVSTTPGLAIAVRVADCVPVLLAGPRGVAAIHAGWRGTAADVVRAGLHALCDRAGMRPAEVRAAVGPSIRGCCYEVGDEVIAGVGAVAPGLAWRSGRHVDLAAANAAILAAEGVAAEVVGGCTRCGGAWFSHRNGDAERQVGVVMLPAAR
jgi:YfiH family protein